jgi:hypothetical protein
MDFILAMQQTHLLKVVCKGCGSVADASGETQGEAVEILNDFLTKTGWLLIAGDPSKPYFEFAYCPYCVRDKVCG